MILLNGHVDDQSFALLVKWFNTLPSQGSIHGFEPRTGYHMFIYSTLLQDVEFFNYQFRYELIFLKRKYDSK